jgi:heterodisulfide reductase subunit B
VRYAFFPGCSLESTAKDFALSTYAVCERLGVDLHEIPKWTCCGSSPAHATDPELATALPVLNLIKAARIGGDVVAPCAACYSRLRAANLAMQDDSEARRRIDEATGVQYRGTVAVRHLLDVLVNDVGIDLIGDYVERPLNGIRVACYYGCLLTRPKSAAFENPENPRSLDRLLAACGAKPVEWPCKTECCGAGLSLTSPEVMRQLTFEIVDMAVQSGAQCVAVACPLCQSNLDLRQGESAAAFGRSLAVPVLYFTQLLGLALGLPASALGINKLVVSPQAVLEQAGVRSSVA